MERVEKRHKKSKKPLIFLIFGLIVLIAGGAMLATRFLKTPAVADADYLVSAREWVKTDTPSVIWTFTEVGKGTLTTDAHLNDYDFLWSLKDGKLLIETDWLYTLENEFDFSLDQAAGKMTLKNGDQEIILESAKK